MTRDDAVLALYVAGGGAIGSAARYLVGVAVQARATSGFPIATLMINISGSLLLGFLMRYALDTTLAPEWRVFLTVGVCGGYTTFSTFSYETVRLLEDGAFARATAYALMSVVCSVAAAWIGVGLAGGALGLGRRG